MLQHGSYCALLGFIICVYAVIVDRFRQSRKRIEALQKESGDSYCEKGQIKFQRKFVNFTRTLKPEFPGHTGEGMCIISFRNEAHTFSLCHIDKSRKRRSSSVVKSLSILVSHVKAATYVLVIVSIYLATWTPFFGYSIYKSLTRMTLDMDESDLGSLSLNVTLLRSSLADALQNKSSQFEVENISNVDDFTKLILQSVEMKILSNIFGNYVSMLNSLANPVLYALWYPDFRKYALLVPHWIMMAFKKSDENVLVVNI